MWKALHSQSGSQVHVHAHVHVCVHVRMFVPLSVGLQKFPASNGPNSLHMRLVSPHPAVIVSTGGSCGVMHGLSMHTIASRVDVMALHLCYALHACGKIS